MQIRTREHQDLIGQFEREFKGQRFDKEHQDLWLKGRVYQDGQANELFLAYRRGYALAKCVYAAAEAGTPPRQEERET